VQVLALRLRSRFSLNAGALPLHPQDALQDVADHGELHLDPM
jgi:hypothetical protein